MMISNLKLKVPQPSIINFNDMFNSKQVLGTPIHENLNISFYCSPLLWPACRWMSSWRATHAWACQHSMCARSPLRKLKLRLEVDTMPPWVTLKGFIPRQSPWKMFVKWFRIASRTVIPDLWTFKTSGCPKPTYVLLSSQTLVNLAFRSLATGCGCCIWERISAYATPEILRQTWSPWAKQLCIIFKTYEF